MSACSPGPVTGQTTLADGLDPAQVETLPIMSDATLGDHAGESEDERENRQDGDGLVCGLSGWFTPHGVRYHEDIRSVSEIDPTNWSMLLEHARLIDFFERPEPAPAGLGDRTIHLRLTVDGRSRELAINAPYETTDLARLVSLVPRALNDRQVVIPETMSDEMVVRLVASLPNMEELRTDRWSWEQD